MRAHRSATYEMKQLHRLRSVQLSSTAMAINLLRQGQEGKETGKKKLLLYFKLYWILSQKTISTYRSKTGMRDIRCPVVNLI